ncbi:unnamed protein product [Caenorhabditis sp. 36 PRJEB53466]|nr:unnamed protein product [Caenorhabditis sp. 36 PRJEB53466]
MFPFLAPIRTANHVVQQGTQHFVEITFLADSPYASRAASASSIVHVADVPPKVPSLRNLDESETETASNKSRSSEGLNKLESRPNSRVKKTSVSSLPTSARSEGKSSPVPVKDAVVPAPSRHKNKGLEMSSAMMEIFGGTSPAPLRKRSEGQQPVSSSVGNHVDSICSSVENHDVAYDRAINRARGRQNFSQPGPEWFEGFERMDVSELDLPPDPNCPAEKALRAAAAATERTPDFDSDWQDAKEDVLSGGGLTSQTRPPHSKSFADSLPGPDIGAGVEEDEEEEEEQLQEQAEYESKVAGDEAEDDETSSSSSSKKGHPSGDEARRDSAANGETADGRRESAASEEGADGQREPADGREGTESKSGGESGGEGGQMAVLLVKNAQIINDDAIFVADVLIDDGVIINVAPNLDAPEGAEVIDASGKMVLPAGIDVYTQASESPVDDLTTGCKAAIAGGTATIIEVVRPRGSESLLAAVKRVKSQLEKAQCHVSLSPAIGTFNEAIRSEMSQLVAAEGINSFVVDGVQQSDDKLFELLEHASKLGAHVRIIPENKSIISILEKKMLKLGVTGPEGFPQSHPETLEADQVNSVCVLGNLANCPVSIVSVSSAEALSSIEKARSSGALAHAEIASAAVAADGSAYLSTDLKVAAAHLTNIPLRKAASDRLISALSTQPLVVCTSGHKPVSTASRASKDFATAVKGSAGAEERMAVVWEKAVRSGRIDPMRFVAVTSSNAAKVFNLYPKKGRIAVGADADLVIWDGSAKRVLEAKTAQSQQDSTLYDGLTVHSTVFATIVAGKVAFKNGQIAESTGGFLPLTPNSPYLFSMVGQRDKFSSVEKVERDSAAPKAHNGHTQPEKSDEFDRNRKKVMESSIDFGGASGNRGRNPPGGRSTGFW